jgi:hypothetical protein
MLVANPMGTDGLEFVEYTAPDSYSLEALFKRLGFAAVARHRSGAVTLYAQGEIKFIVNHEPASFAQAFARVHGASVCAFVPRPLESGPGPGMQFDFGHFIAHAAKTRPLCAGTIIGSGTVSNRDATRGQACIVERRVIETLETGTPRTPFVTAGERVRIEFMAGDGGSPFGAIEKSARPGALNGKRLMNSKKRSHAICCDGAARAGRPGRAIRAHRPAHREAGAVPPDHHGQPLYGVVCTR